MRAETSHQAVLAKAKSNGYRREAHTDRDILKALNKHEDKTKRNHQAMLNYYVVWWYDKIQDEHPDRPPPKIQSVEKLVLCKDARAPSMVEVKDFMRFYIAQSKGHLTEHATVKSVEAMALAFYAGFTRVTGTATAAEDRSEVYHWIKYVLPKDGLIVNRRRPKHNFQVQDLNRVLLALWACSEVLHISERDRIEFAFFIHVYCWSGARVSAFFDGGGLRYTDILLVMRRRHDGQGYELMWKIDQRWVKGNRDPENVLFGISGKEHSRLLYNDGALLLPLAFADKALYDYKSLDDLWQEQKIPEGDNELILLWDEEVKDRRIMRMSKSKFLRILKLLLEYESYFVPISIHQIRRSLGKMVDERYTPVERSQHILQSDPRIFGQSYVANCSSVDGQAAFLNEKADHSTVDYFQGLKRFREPGLPNVLPAAKLAELEKDPRLTALRAKARTALDAGERNKASKEHQALLERLKREALASFREAWVEQRRKEKIETRGKGARVVDEKNRPNLLDRIIPERGRIREKMKLEAPLSQVEMREAIRDLYTLCTRDCEVFYRPGEEPVDGRCRLCGEDTESMKKGCRSAHIHRCCKIQKAQELNRPASSLKYCFYCHEWHVEGPEWDEHCLSHLSPLPRRCGSITYLNTLILPAHCPACLKLKYKAPSLRLQPWDRDAEVFDHIEKAHLKTAKWPLSSFCCDDVVHHNTESLYHHLQDCHRLRLPLHIKNKFQDFDAGSVKEEDMKKQDTKAKKEHDVREQNTKNMKGHDVGGSGTQYQRRLAPIPKTTKRRRQDQSVREEVPGPNYKRLRSLSPTPLNRADGSDSISPILIESEENDNEDSFFKDATYQYPSLERSESPDKEGLPIYSTALSVEQADVFSEFSDYIGIPSAPPSVGDENDALSAISNYVIIPSTTPSVVDENDAPSSPASSHIVTPSAMPLIADKNDGAFVVNTSTTPSIMGENDLGWNKPTNATVQGTDTGPRLQIRLRYKAPPKIILRVGRPSNPSRRRNYKRSGNA